MKNIKYFKYLFLTGLVLAAGWFWYPHITQAVLPGGLYLTGEKLSGSSTVLLDTAAADENYLAIKSDLENKFKELQPGEWGANIPGVITRFLPSAGVSALALTFDACDGEYNQKLIDFLVQQKIPATLFLSGKWIRRHPLVTRLLAQNSLFEIENHGTQHHVCSLAGHTAYHLGVTRSVGNIIDEIEKNNQTLLTLTGRAPKYFRSAGDYVDEGCVTIAHALGYQVVGVGTIGDAGTTFSASQIKQALLSAPAGSIVGLHMNRPHSQDLAGIEAALPILRARGTRFVTVAQGIAGL